MPGVVVAGVVEGGTLHEEVACRDSGSGQGKDSAECESLGRGTHNL